MYRISDIMVSFAHNVPPGYLYIGSRWYGE